MAKKTMLTENQSDVDLTILSYEINKSLFHNLPERQTDIQDSKTVSNQFSLSLVEEHHDIRSRSQLSEEQHKNPEISPLFEKAVSEMDLAQDPIYFYIKMGY